MSTKSFLDAADLLSKIEKITKERMKEKQVVSLSEFRRLKRPKSSYTLLIIEDDVNMQAALKRIFDNEGYTSFIVSDATELSSIIEKTAFDIILLDIGLPWINGYELASLMKSHNELKNIPLIFVSGLNSKEDMKKGFSVGADDYISKPFDVEEITRTVNTLLQLNE